MDRELLDHIRDYLNDHCTLQDLESWLLSNMQRILDSGDEAAIDVANEIDADLVELGEGLLDEVTFREHLQSLSSRRDTIPIYFPDIVLHTMPHATVAVETIRNSFEDPRPVVDVHRDLVLS